jgi:hypothetical protein
MNLNKTFLAFLFLTTCTEFQVYGMHDADFNSTKQPDNNQFQQKTTLNDWFFKQINRARDATNEFGKMIKDRWTKRSQSKPDVRTTHDAQQGVKLSIGVPNRVTDNQPTPTASYSPDDAQSTSSLTSSQGSHEAESISDNNLSISSPQSESETPNQRPLTTKQKETKQKSLKATLKRVNDAIKLQEEFKEEYQEVTQRDQKALRTEKDADKIKKLNADLLSYEKKLVEIQEILDTKLADKRKLTAALKKL